jgi:hypothetical protein
MISVYRPETPTELALAESILEANGIPYFVHNAGLGSLYPGVQLHLFNTRTIMVPPSAVPFAKEVLAYYLSDLSQLRPISEPSILHFLRMLVEAIFGGWVVPRIVSAPKAPDQP